jgi:hypothetical protein
MIRYELRRNGILFHATHSADEAFRLFRKWMGRGTTTEMSFVRVA